jgi:hypothetical protein
MPMGRVLFKCIYTLSMIFLLFAGSMLTFENKATYAEINEILATELTNPEHFEHDGKEKLAELENRVYFYHDMLYYVFVTFSSVGYGDIYPRTDECKALFFVFWAVMIMGLQAQVSEYSKVTKLSSEYSRLHYTKSDRETKHILLLGDG